MYIAKQCVVMGQPWQNYALCTHVIEWKTMNYSAGNGIASGTDRPICLTSLPSCTIGKDICLGGNHGNEGRGPYLRQWL